MPIYIYCKYIYLHINHKPQLTGLNYSLIHQPEKCTDKFCHFNMIPPIQTVPVTPQCNSSQIR